jgi:hypothetical protein
MLKLTDVSEICTASIMIHRPILRYYPVIFLRLSQPVSRPDLVPGSLEYEAGLLPVGLYVRFLVVKVRVHRYPLSKTFCEISSSHGGASMMFRDEWARVAHPWWWRQYAPLKRRSTIILHGSTSQKTILNINHFDLHLATFHRRAKSLEGQASWSRQTMSMCVHPHIIKVHISYAVK